MVFNTFDAFLIPPQNVCSEASPEISNEFLFNVFLNFFLLKRLPPQGLLSHLLTLTLLSQPLALLSLITLSLLEDVVCRLKPSGSPHDPVPPQFFFKEVIPL